jgi:hypothetical protein
MGLGPRASALLTIGYGWADPHVNTLLDEFLRPPAPVVALTRRSGKVDVGEGHRLPSERYFHLIAGTEWVAADNFAYHEQSGEPKRRGNWEAVLKPVVARYKGKTSRICFRGDAAFAMPSMYEYLESEGIEYAIRLPANQILQNEIAHLLRRPVGRPPHYVQRLYSTFRYQAGAGA